MVEQDEKNSQSGARTTSVFTTALVMFLPVVMFERPSSRTPAESIDMWSHMGGARICVVWSGPTTNLALACSRCANHDPSVLSPCKLPPIIISRRRDRKRGRLLKTFAGPIRFSSACAFSRIVRNMMQNGVGSTFRIRWC